MTDSDMQVQESTSLSQSTYGCFWELLELKVMKVPPEALNDLPKTLEDLLVALQECLDHLRTHCT